MAFQLEDIVKDNRGRLGQIVCVDDADYTQVDFGDMDIAYIPSDWLTFVVNKSNKDEWYSFQEEMILASIPTEFHGTLSYMAYERGHSSGRDECLLILQNLVNDLSKSIDEFGERKYQEGCTVGAAGL